LIHQPLLPPAFFLFVVVAAGVLLELKLVTVVVITLTLALELLIGTVVPELNAISVVPPIIVVLPLSE
jgi:hypothetical protein